MTGPESASGTTPTQQPAATSAPTGSGGSSGDLAASPARIALERRVRAVTPARLFLGRSGTSYRTADQLALRADHAAAQDAVHAALDLETGPLAPLVDSLGLFAVDSAAADRATYLRRPDLGRALSAEARDEVARRCPPAADLQVVIGDGLSVAAVDAQVPALLPALLDAAREAGWSAGQVFAVRNARVGLLNEIGELLDPGVVVLLIGERPGLVTAQSLSAYLAWRPRPGHTDADRNLISNIHPRGVDAPSAVARVLSLATAMRAAGTSGVLVKEDLGPAALGS
ncbi:ethanolamine ammonia-lyase subunit EutC [Pseudofrankia inefficax]|uniref:Ethanolamine ammonia-lyase small subunit n=1 Tax=Pseudofrankia inefficax (strain DSM 45817 / CECT 9037 / DDB 130130 / EuI1c) TaxID=298654 RepID=E3IZD7_PSEI1|nr:ethanolamine ammonia-lyase subunit EutC [Pseudofrankia inefficax]ADP82707.1 Ethanolamine ammonia-lyase [Pseudofrankia inefficax]